MVSMLLIVILFALIVAAILAMPVSYRSLCMSRFSHLTIFIRRVLSRFGTNTNSNTQNALQTANSQKLDMNALNCRAGQSSTLQEGSFVDVFCVEICGLIRSAEQGQSIKVNISIQDVTEGSGRTIPVNAKIKQYQIPDSEEFSYTADLGRIPGGQAVLSD